jgi:membrane protease YdiL (CAAX protease family)
VIVLIAFLVLARLSQSQLDDSTVRELVPRRTTPTGTDPGVAAEERPEIVVRLPRPKTTLDGTIESMSTTALLANVALTQGVFGAVIVGSGLAFAIPLRAFGADNLVAQLLGMPLLVGVALGVGLWLASELGSRAVDAAGIEHDESLRAMLAPDSTAGWLVLLLLVLPVIAGVEELVFRAAAIGVVSTAYGISPWLLAVLSSLAFGIGHGAQGTAGVLVTGILGLVLAAAFVLTGSLIVVFVAHYLVNALEFLVHEGPWTAQKR